MSSAFAFPPSSPPFPFPSASASAIPHGTLMVKDGRDALPAATT